MLSWSAKKGFAVDLSYFSSRLVPVCFQNSNVSNDTGFTLSELFPLKFISLSVLFDHQRETHILTRSTEEYITWVERTSPAKIILVITNWASFSERFLTSV